MQYPLRFHVNFGCNNELQYQVISILPVLLSINFSCLYLSDIYGKNVLSSLSVNTSTKKKIKRSVTRSSNLIAPTVILPVHDRAIADKERSYVAWPTSAIQRENNKEKHLNAMTSIFHF